MNTHHSHDPKSTTSFSVSANPWLIFLATALGIGMIYIDSSMVNVALPTICNDLGIPKLSSAQWIISSYMLMMCIFLPIAGYLGDRLDQRNVYLSGFILFVLASLGCGLSSSLSQLIVWRAIEGVGAALILANNLPILMKNIAKEFRGRATGINTMVFSSACIIGPGLGGILIQWLPWTYIFFINIPIGLLGLLFSVILVPKNKKDETHFQLPYKRPRLDLSLFKNKRYVFSIAAAFLLLSAISTNNILLPFFLQNHLHISVLHVGFLMLLPSVLTFIFSPIAGYITDRFTTQHAIIPSLLLLIIALLLQSQFLIHIPQILFIIILSQILLGIGYGLFQSPNNYKILHVIPASHMSRGNGIASLMRNTGRMSGVLSSSFLFSFLQTSSTSLQCTANCAYARAFSLTLLAACFLAILAMMFSFGRVLKHTETNA